MKLGWCRSEPWRSPVFTAVLLVMVFPCATGPLDLAAPLLAVLRRPGEAALVGNFLAVFLPWSVEDPGLVAAFLGDFWRTGDAALSA